jgi:hypothetical protein
MGVGGGGWSEGGMKVESGMEWNTGIGDGGGCLSGRHESRIWNGMEPWNGTWWGGGGGDGVGWAWNRIRLFQVKWNSKGFYTMISILFVSLFHWNVDRDSSPRQKAIPVLFQVFPLYPLVLCVDALCMCN